MKELDYLNLEIAKKRQMPATLKSFDPLQKLLVDRNRLRKKLSDVEGGAIRPRSLSAPSVNQPIKRDDSLRGEGDVQFARKMTPMVVSENAMVQPTDYSCAPTVMCEILNKYRDSQKKPLKVEELALKLRTTKKGGTSLKDVERLFREEYGLDFLDIADFYHSPSDRFGDQGVEYFGVLPGHAVLIEDFQYNGPDKGYKYHPRNIDPDLMSVRY